MSVFSPKALPAGADITVIADAVSPAQRVALAHGSPLPLRLQRALTHSTQHAAKASTTAFNAPQGRRVAHVEVPEVCARMCGMHMQRGACWEHMILCCCKRHVDRVVENDCCWSRVAVCTIHYEQRCCDGGTRLSSRACRLNPMQT